MNLINNLQHPEILALALQLAATMGDDLLPVEVKVATAGNALEELWRALVPGHELSTPIDGIVTEAHRVVLDALEVSEIGHPQRHCLG